MEKSNSEVCLTLTLSLDIEHDRGDEDEDENDDENNGDKANSLLLPQNSVKILNLSKKIAYSKTKWRRIFARYGGRNAVRLFICFLLFPIVFVGQRISTHSSMHLRQTELFDWRLNVSRNVSDYVLPANDTTLLEPGPLWQANEKVFLLIVVCSSLKNYALRQTIRETWGNTTAFNYDKFAEIHRHLKGEYLEPSEERLKYYSEFLILQNNHTTTSTSTNSAPIEVPVRVVFLLGSSKAETYNETLQEIRLRSEARQYQDIIQEDFIDSYNNLTIKTVFALKWITRNCLNNCAFIMKSDDDVFVNVPNLLQYLLGGTIPFYEHTISFYHYRQSLLLSQKQRHQELRNFLVGYLHWNAMPVENSSSKWYMPYDMYPASMYPDYLSGSSYLMSIDVVPLIYEIALKTELVYLEDIFITGVCAEKADLKRVHQPLFLYEKLERMCGLKGIITQHRMNENDILQAYAFINNLTNICHSSNFFYENFPLQLLKMNFF